MKSWIGRTLGICALAAALFAPVAKAEAPAGTAAATMRDCTLVKCSDIMSCCNHCVVRNTLCTTRIDGE